VTSEIVAHAALRHGALVRTLHSLAAVPDAVAALARPGDLVLTMGAGDITSAGPEILARLESVAPTET
jgi:UDP-N-acetylmuramate--alanine ligase